MLAQLHAVVIFWVHLVEFWLEVGVFLLHVLLQHTNSELSGVNRRRNLWYQVVEGANVVKVPMGNHHGLNF